MKDEIITDGILQKTCKIGQEKEQYVIMAYLYVERFSKFTPRKIFSFDKYIMDCEVEIRHKEQSDEEKENPVGEFIVEDESNNEQAAQNTYTCDPPQRQKPPDDLV